MTDFLQMQRPRGPRPGLPITGSSSSQTNLLLVTEQDIENMISKLEKLEILGENVLRYWDRDKVLCELKIKNPENFLIFL